ncbi:AAA domain containing protein [Amanita muscaria]
MPDPHSLEVLEPLPPLLTTGTTTTTTTPSLKIRIRPLGAMPAPTSSRPKTRSQTASAGPSGSEYHESSDHDHVSSPREERVEREDKKPMLVKMSRSGRVVTKKNYEESDYEEKEEEDVLVDRKGRQIKREAIDGAARADQLFDDGIEAADASIPMEGIDGDGLDSHQYADDDEDEDEDGQGPRVPKGRKRFSEAERLLRDAGGFVVPDEIAECADDEDYGTRSKNMTRLRRSQKEAEKKLRSKNGGRSVRKGRQTANSLRAGHDESHSSTLLTEGKRLKRLHKSTNGDDAKNNKLEDDDDAYVDDPSSGTSADGEGSLDDAAPSSILDIDMSNPQPAAQQDRVDPDPDPTEDDGKPYQFRQRQRRVNYALPPPIEEMVKPPGRYGGRHGRGNAGGAGAGGGGYRGHGKKGVPGWSASGAELSKYIRIPGDDSDSDYATRTPRKFGAAAASAANIASLGSGMAAGGFLPGDLAAAGTPSNLGKIGEAALADADPLGVNMNVTFDEIGGLDEHIHSLKEMTLLPLLYPEVFQQFNITPPRGVLFHGPPGTGKTLMARALAASCRSNGKQISFFMRKGADCLSKWVGEAERQLRLLFDEAKASQPSIIFFDEIDGLAPVRSSKQDQIHASIVSTLLALMDGMDGRGQVVVIGATNRPDAVDPALRRPGRFDREFYFGLPTVEAREKILGIMTRKWAGWNEDAVEDVKEKVRGLAAMTKGYGGADLRALCTEAALNAVQRRYPQIYKSTDRLMLKAETINIGLRDFMISIKKIVPSSARSSASAASPLPSQFVPLLGDALEQIKNTITRVMPMEKRLSALEEAEYEDIGGEEGALEKVMLMQAMQTLRIYRPRVVIHGPIGMGQHYVGAAALHYLEGYHVQSLELGTLMSDSTRTVEAAIVQLFVEAKRHQPSVIYIPSLAGWCAAIEERSRSTVRAMLDTLAPTDPILLLAVVDGEFSTLPRDVKAWFGPTKNNRVTLSSPTVDKCAQFFEGLINDVCRPPNMYADGMGRKKRVLEELPIAPPLEPRQPTVAELALQEESDQRTIALLKYRLGPILTELKRKYKRFCKRASEEYNFDFFPPEVAVTPVDPVGINGNPQPLVDANPDGNIIVDEAGIAETTAVNGGQVAGETTEAGLQQQQQQLQLQLQQQQAVLLEQPKLYDMDLERMHDELYRGRYITPQDFLEDTAKILRNAEARAHEDLDRLHKAQAMYTFAEVSILEFDPALRMECQRMAVRERKRREEHRKSREKLKEKEDAAQLLQQQQNGNGNGMMTRRSARANGLELDIRITDPVKLERRLKRQRSEAGGDASTDSHASEEGDGEGRESKRPKRAPGTLDGQQDIDELDIIGPSPVPSPRPQLQQQHHPHHHHHQHQHVRFAGVERQPSPLPHAPLPPEAGPSSGILVERRGETTDVANPTPRKQTSGFDPFLLNPVSPSEPIFHHSRSPTPGHTMVNGISSNIPPQPIQDADPSNPFFTPRAAPPRPSQEASSLAPPMSVDMNILSQPSAMEVVDPSLSYRNADFLKGGGGGEQAQHLELPHEAMVVVERTPTPLPDFHVDQGLLDELRRRLVQDTVSMTVEQLEQLRATCLGCVWRHRQEWNRDELLRELLKLVEEFAGEVLVDDEE